MLEADRIIGFHNRCGHDVTESLLVPPWFDDWLHGQGFAQARTQPGKQRQEIQVVHMGGVVIQSGRPSGGHVDCRHQHRHERDIQMRIQTVGPHMRPSLQGKARMPYLVKAATDKPYRLLAKLAHWRCAPEVSQHTTSHERDCIVRRGVVFSDVAVTLELCSNGVAQSRCLVGCITEPGVHECDVGVVRADSIHGLAARGVVHGALHVAPQIIGEHMAIEPFGCPQYECQKLSPVGVVVAPFAITQSAVGVERARVGLAGMSFKRAGPAWVGIQRILMLQHVVQGSLCPFYLAVF